MNGAHLHLLLNHLPVLGMVFVIPLLAYAWWRGGEQLRRVALFATVVAGLLALPAFYTGDPAEETIEHLPGVRKEAIDAHEEMADVALSVSLITAAVAATGLVVSWRRKQTPKMLLAASLGCACIAAVIMGITANRGGAIRHPEIHGETKGEAAPSIVAASRR